MVRQAVRQKPARSTAPGSLLHNGDFDDGDDLLAGRLDPRSIYPERTPLEREQLAGGGELSLANRAACGIGPSGSEAERPGAPTRPASP